MQSNYVDLLREITLADFKLRYYGSKLGVLWAFAKPFLMFAVLYTVFSFITRFNVENYAWFLLLGIILWSFFAETTTRSIFNMQNKSEFIKRVFFPREIIVYSSALNSLMAFSLNMAAYTALLFLFNGPIGVKALLIIVPALLLFLFSLGIAFILASVFVKVKDIAHLWDVFLQAFFWLTPIVYPVSLIPQKYRWILLLNPVASAINAARNPVVFGKMPDSLGLISLAVFSLTALLLGALVFRWRSKYFAEEL